jgi:hypothetical protein
MPGRDGSSSSFWGDDCDKMDSPNRCFFKRAEHIIGGEFWESLSARRRHHMSVRRRRSAAVSGGEKKAREFPPAPRASQ